jgi:hypothetical protein
MGCDVKLSLAKLQRRKEWTSADHPLGQTAAALTFPMISVVLR